MKRKRSSLILGPLLLGAFLYLGPVFISVTSAQENPTPELLVSVPPIHFFPKVVQNQGECEVASLFNAFQFATPESHSAIQELKGNSLAEKYASFLKTYALQPTKDYPVRGLLRTTESGTSPFDLVVMAQEFQRDHAKYFSLRKNPSDLFVGKFYIRKNQSEDFGLFVKRAHDEMRESIQHGFPLVLNLAGYQEKHLPNGDTIHSKIFRHATTVLGISQNLTGDEFSIEFIDPLDGNTHSAQIFESRNPVFAFIRNKGELEFTKVVGEMPNGVNSPMLTVESPYLKSQNPEVDYFLMEFVLGYLAP
jgi:hypothetical protein